MRICPIAIVLLLAGLLAGCGATATGDTVLFDFESDADLDRINWQCFVVFSISDQFGTHGSRSLKVELYPSAFPGFNPNLPLTNWNGYRALEFDIANPAETELPISLRIDDRPGSPEYVERFGRELALRPGVNHIVVRLDELVTAGGRRMDSGRIEKLFLFHQNPPAPVIFYIDNMRLVK